jgi:hypothetical protein
MRRRAAVFALLLITVSCGEDQPGTAAVDAEALTADAAAAMATITSTAFTMERSGAPIEISGMVFDTARGEYAAPDAARALLEMTVGDLSLELGTIAVGDRVWLTNPLTGSWEELAVGTGFNPAVVFDPQVGWVPLLTEDLSDPTWLRSEAEVHVIRAEIAAARVEQLTAGLVAAQPVEADLHIDADSSRIVRVEFSTEGSDGVSQWVIEMGDFDAPVTVEPPATG